MNSGKSAIEELTMKVATACDNALGAQDIMDVLTLYGYTAEILTGVKEGILAELSNSADAQQKEYNDQYLATDALRKLKAEFDETYVRHLKLIRIVLAGEPVRLKTLAASGSQSGHGPS